VDFRLESASGDRRFVLPDGQALQVGRDPIADLPILDQGVSRRHAELRADGRGVEVRDLGSRNGTFLNGRRVSHARAVPGDRLAFGPVELRLQRDEAPVAPSARGPVAGIDAAMVREREMPTSAEAVDGVTDRRLAQLVAAAQRLGGTLSVDALLERIVADLFETLPADRVAVLLGRSADTLDTRIALDRSGAPLHRHVPRQITGGVADRRIALLTHDARDDVRTAGQSVLAQAVRSAIAAPLLGQEHDTLGVLYADNLRDVEAFTDADLSFLVAYAGIAAAAVEREQAAEQLREARRVRDNFARYFSPQLAERIAAEAGRVTTGGTRRPVVVLFADIRGFTAVAESLPPDLMAAQLNEYFGAMVSCVFRHEGALDKFIGDALMAWWGAPEPRDDDADRAVRAAFAMRHALAGLNARWALEGRPLLRAGIGIHAGDAFVGNIGSPQRLEYTLIGDTVNFANRICGLAAGGEVLVSEAVRRLLHGDLRLRPRPDVRPQRHLAAPDAIWEADAVDTVASPPSAG
jgi:adenylate cyclase